MTCQASNLTEHYRMLISVSQLGKIILSRTNDFKCKNSFLLILQASIFLEAQLSEFNLFVCHKDSWEQNGRQLNSGSRDSAVLFSRVTNLMLLRNRQSILPKYHIIFVHMVLFEQLLIAATEDQAPQVLKQDIGLLVETLIALVPSSSLMTLFFDYPQH